MSYRSDDPADTAGNDYDYFATKAANMTEEEEDALYAQYLWMTYGLPADEQAAVARMSTPNLNEILTRSEGKRCIFMTPHEYALRFAAKVALEEQGAEEESCSGRT
jgi:hypothetical protein